MGLPELPYIALDRVFHIGTLDKTQIGRNSGSHSLEGNNLSVSVCPHAWRFIARLGGNNLYEMHRKNGRFVDIHAIRDQGLLPEVLEWAKAEKLVKDVQLWRAWSKDAETDEWRYELFPDENSAWYEVDPDEGGPDGGEAVEEVTVPIAQWKLISITGIKLRGDEDATDAVLLAAAMNDNDADGAWWRETYDPDALSSPRGAIFQSKVSAWKPKQIGWADVDDEEELARFDEALGLSHPSP